MKRSDPGRNPENNDIKNEAKEKNKRLYFISLLTGALLALAFPPLPLPMLAWIAFIPMLFALEMRPRKPLLMIFLTFFVYHAGANWWIGSWQSEADPFLIASGVVLFFFHPLFFMIPMIIYRYLNRKLGRNTALWLFPFIWTGFEWFHSLGELSYPWLTVGYSQVYNYYWIQVADLAGVWGISFLIAMINVLLLRIIFMSRDISAQGRPLADIMNYPRFYRFVIPLLVLLFVPFLYGYSSINRFEHDTISKLNPKIKIALIQPNVNPWEKWSSDALKQMELHKNIADSLYQAADGFDLAVWSETAIPFYDLELNSRHNFSYLQEWINLQSISLLTGFSDLYIYKPNEETPVTARNLFGDSTIKYSAYNAAILLNPNTQALPDQIYHKMKLTPFSERLPYADMFHFALSWIQWGVGISSWEFGSIQKPLDLVQTDKKASVGNIICIESIYPGFVRNYAGMGAQVYTIITNDAWFDHTPGPEQHYAIAQVRAIESRRYIARCANTGVTGFITATGKTLKRAPEYRSVGISEWIPLLEDKTFYVRTGDWLPQSCAAICVIAIVFAVLLKRKE